MEKHRVLNVKDNWWQVWRNGCEYYYFGCRDALVKKAGHSVTQNAP
jgi:hypothetical protein